MSENINMGDVSVTEENGGMTDLQIYGINGSIVKLLSKMRKYAILTQIQMELVNKPHNIQPIMREIYQFEETKMIMEIREEFDTFYVYTKDTIVLKNVEMLREKFEQSISFITSNMQQLNSILDKEYIEILDTFTDNLQQLSTAVASKSIFDEHFTV
jgi:hypothetical protein